MYICHHKRRNANVSYQSRQRSWTSKLGDRIGTGQSKIDVSFTLITFTIECYNRYWSLSHRKISCGSERKKVANFVIVNKLSTYYVSNVNVNVIVICRRAIEIDEEEDDKNVLSIPSQELNAAISELSSKLENLRTCNDLISKNGRALQSALAELENGDDLASKTKLVTERATLFRISSNAMINVSMCNRALFSLVLEFSQFLFVNLFYKSVSFENNCHRLVVITFRQLKVKDTNGRRWYRTNAIKGNSCRWWSSNWPDNIRIWKRQHIAIDQVIRFA